MNIQTTNNNQADIEERQFAIHMRAFAEADAACDKARLHRNKVRKQAKVDGFFLYEIDEANKWADRGMEEARRHFETLKRYMGFMHFPLGTQLELLPTDDDPTAEDSGEKSEARTLEENSGKGFLAGVRGVGQKEALEAAGLKGNDPMGQEFLKAWTAGQGVIAGEMGSKH